MAKALQVHQIQNEVREFIKTGSASSLKRMLSGPLNECDHVEFKEEGELDKKKLARHVLGLANSGGGCLVFGVSDGDSATGPRPVGCARLQDATKVKDQLAAFVSAELLSNVVILDYDSADVGLPELTGRRFRLLVIEPNDVFLPYKAKRATDGLDPEEIYVRRNGSSVAAKAGDIERLVERKHASLAPSSKAHSLEGHLTQLETLYTHINCENTKMVLRTPASLQGQLRRLIADEGGDSHMTEAVLALQGWANLERTLKQTVQQAFASHERVVTPNPHYPEESFDEFIGRAIGLKKKLVLRELGV